MLNAATLSRDIASAVGLDEERFQVETLSTETPDEVVIRIRTKEPSGPDGDHGMQSVIKWDELCGLTLAEMEIDRARVLWGCLNRHLNSRRCEVADPDV